MSRGVGRLVVSVTVAIATALSLLVPAVADGPADKARAAIQRTAQAKTARISVTHTYSSKDRALEQRVSGALAGGDHDLVTDGERGKGRQVAVGTDVYDRQPDAAGGSWRRSTRAAPVRGSALGPLTLADGTHIGDPKLQRSATSAGIETLGTGPAEKIVIELDMSAVAAAMRLTGADAERISQMEGTLTVWMAEGRITRNGLRLVIPGAIGPTTLETTIDLSDLDAPITVTAPAAP